MIKKWGGFYAIAIDYQEREENERIERYLIMWREEQLADWSIAALRESCSKLKVLFWISRTLPFDRTWSLGTHYDSKCCLTEAVFASGPSLCFLLSLRPWRCNYSDHSFWSCLLWRQLRKSQLWCRDKRFSSSNDLGRLKLCDKQFPILCVCLRVFSPACCDVACDVQRPYLVESLGCQKIFSSSADWR